MKASNIFLISFVIILIFSTGCKKKCKELSTLSFSSENKQIIPYHGTELLILSSGEGTLDSLRGSGRLDQFNDITSNSSSITDDQNCNGDFYKIEYSRIIFTTIMKTSAIQLTLSLEFNNPFKTLGTYKYLNILFGATYDYGGFFTNTFLFENDSILTNDSTVFFHKTILIGIKQFDSVYELHGYHNKSNYGAIIYYKIKEGIVATNNYHGNIWYFTKLD